MPLPIGESGLLSSEVFRALSSPTTVKAGLYGLKVVELEGVKNLIDLKFTFARRVEVGQSTLVKLVYSQSM